MPKDLNRLLMPAPEKIRHMRVGEDGLEGIGLRRGDLLIIDVTITPTPGSIVVAVHQGRFWVRRWTRTSGMIHLIKAGITGPDFSFHHPGEVDVFGVVTHSIRPLHPPQRRRLLNVRPAPPEPLDKPVYVYGRAG